MADAEQIQKMDRRDFLRLTLMAAGVSIIGGGAYLYGKRVDLSDPLSVQTLLNEFSDIENSLRLIGEKYREMNPGDLTERGLLKQINEKLSAIKNDRELFSDLRDLIDQQIKKDYLNSDFVEIEGWILSTTEAQICAIFSI